MPLPLSVLDLAPIAPGETASSALATTARMAQAADQAGYQRVWYAEHHNMPTIASSATSVLIAHVAAHTERIRVGAGGIMLPNHSPLTIAEQFGTLGALHPGRIDLGLGRAPGRAPGGDRAVFAALRRSPTDSDRFPDDVAELRDYLAGASRVPGVQSVPAATSPADAVPLYILGSSLFGAQLAAALGLPYAFASHFAPAALHEAVRVYRDTFRPSDALAEPYVIAGVSVFAAENADDAAAQFAASRRFRVRALIPRGPAVKEYSDDEVDAFLASPRGAQLAQMARYTAVGTASDVREYLETFADEAHADESITVHGALASEDRERSLRLAAPEPPAGWDGA
ncbi:LLM class flavin-dependent oxidoreductase [Demequina sp. TTPB684]|uniref:LLM class flavin-dependent oxidoreductase n=1 Tax=unclassified Demequina TaxID=2620311 RepID=UPI001CF440D9|nr:MULTISPECIES: LLM class flavin-dependent oxidoreductase [unclassified Demequina]MCB2412339.1 LLM class flavin-dependent oxidoreductase [Demequina sp. TTPB684]UPU88508.1 LLM class flavin-dependent oxidoreductase [Demequina sp. TMPB413]